MHDDVVDMNAALMLDGNAIAGELQRMFGRDMTMVATRCSACARDTEIGALMAYTRGPGVVLRCPACEAAVVRVVQTDASYYLDARGAAFMRLSK
jgi:hypothetical protein